MERDREGGREKEIITRANLKFRSMCYPIQVMQQKLELKSEIVHGKNR